MHKKTIKIIIIVIKLCLQYLSPSTLAQFFRSRAWSSACTQASSMKYFYAHQPSSSQTFTLDHHQLLPSAVGLSRRRTRDDDRRTIKLMWHLSHFPWRPVPPHHLLHRHRLAPVSSRLRRSFTFFASSGFRLPTTRHEEHSKPLLLSSLPPLPSVRARTFAM